jgi:hypothetical protein
VFFDENCEEQQATWLFFRTPIGRRPGISAEDETSMADNSLQRTAKTAMRRMTSRVLIKVSEH